MATYFCDHGLATGSNDGSSWEDAFQSYTSFVAALLTGGPHTGWIKTHSGISASLITLNATVTIKGGCPAAWSGTYTSDSERDGVTVFDGGGANDQFIYITAGSADISRLKCQDFRATSGAAIRAATTGSLVMTEVHVDNCGNIASGFYDAGGFSFLSLSSVSLVSCSVKNTYGRKYASGRIANSVGSVNIQGCVFEGNTCVTSNESLSIDVDDFVLENTKIVSNTSITVGGLWARYTNAGLVRNCVIADNVGGSDAGGLNISGGATQPTVVNCTIVGNESTGTSDGGVIGGSVYNCIVRDNVGSSTNRQCSLCQDIQYSDISDLSGDGIYSSSYSNCIDTDPQFFGTGDDPYQLTASTPATVTQGANTGVTGYVDYDILGEDRDNSTPSMGAYEYIAAGPDLLLGDDTECTSNANANYHYVGVFTATSTGIANQFGIWSAGNNVKLSLYDITDGFPGKRIWSRNTSDALSAGFNLVDIPNTLIVSGRTYGIGAAISNNGTLKYRVTTGNMHYYKGVTFASFEAPDDLSTYSSSSDATILGVSLFGALGYVAPTMVVSGDSFSDSTYHDWMASLLGDEWSVDIQNFAAGGRLAETINNNWAVDDAGTSTLGDGENWFFLFAGTNDFGGGATASEVLGYLEAIAAKAVTKGFEGRVVCFTLPDQDGWYTDTLRTTLNASILASSSFDFVVDLATTTGLTDASDTDYFEDGLHLTALGARLAAQEVIDTCSPLFTINPDKFVAGWSQSVDQLTVDVDVIGSLYQVQETGTLKSVRFEAATSGNVKVAVRADSSGSVGAVIDYAASPVAVTAGYNKIDLDGGDQTLTAGDWVWIIIANSTYLVEYKARSGADFVTGTDSYAAFSPSGTFNVDSYGSDYHNIMEVWAEIAVPLEDAPQTGAYQYSGLTLSATRSLLDAPQTGAYQYSGLALTAVRALADSPQPGAYQYSGATVDFTKQGAYEDAPQSGAYQYIGSALTTLSALLDAPQAGAYQYSGATVDFSVSGQLGDSPQPGAYQYSGLALTATRALLDAPQAGAHQYSGAAVDFTSSITDTPQAGAYQYSGASLDTLRTRIDAPQSGEYQYSGLTLSAYSDLEDTPQSGAYQYNGAAVDVFKSRADSPQPGTYQYSVAQVLVLYDQLSLLLPGAYQYSGSLLTVSSSAIPATPGKLRDKFPVFAGLTDEQILPWLEEAALELDQDSWGVWYEYGLTYLAAYLLSQAYASEIGANGTVVWKLKVGESETEFAAPESAFFAGAHSDNWFGYRYDEIVSYHVGQHVIEVSDGYVRGTPVTDDGTPVTIDSIRTKFPEFASYTDAQIQPSLDEALLELWEDNWGDKYTLGLQYFTAYLLTQSVGGTTAQRGPVTKRREGRVSVSFAQSDRSAAGPHSLNWYGSRYDQLVYYYIGSEVLVV